MLEPEQCGIDTAHCGGGSVSMCAWRYMSSQIACSAAMSYHPPPGDASVTMQCAQPPQPPSCM
jgi:hypothetical protein